jgi:hypothetical protein
MPSSAAVGTTFTTPAKAVLPFPALVPFGAHITPTAMMLSLFTIGT